MPSRPVIVAFLCALVIAVVATLAALWQHAEAQGYKDRAESAERQLAQTQDRMARIQTQATQAQKAAQEAGLRLQEALNANPAWRDAAVPAAVADGMCGRLRCK